MIFLQRLHLAFLSAAFLGATALGAAPAKFAKFLKTGQVIKGEVVIVRPPEGIQPYLSKVQKAAEADPEWYAEHSSSAQPGSPVPYHEKIGLTEAEYQAYLKEWDKREFVAIQPVGIELQEEGKSWVIRVSGPGWPISLLKYQPEKDRFLSTNGELVTIDDVDAPAESILRAWKGHEWRYEEKSNLTVLKENFAIGAAADKKHGFIIYRLQEVSSTGRLLDDKSVVIRYEIPK